MRPVAREGTEFEIECDIIISAIGQTGNFTGVDEMDGGRGFINVNADYSVKGHDKHFAGGDILRPHLLTTAIGHGRIAAETIGEFLDDGDTAKRPKIDVHTCIGCRYCMMACPFKARSFIHEKVTDQKSYAPRGKGTVEGCTLCVHRVDTGRIPACVEACKKTGNEAMIFGDLKDPASKISRRVATYPSSALRADLKLDPGVRYTNL